MSRLNEINRDILVHHVIPFIDSKDRNELSNVNRYFNTFQNDYVYREYLVDNHHLIESRHLSEKIKRNVVDTTKQIAIIVRDTMIRDEDIYLLSSVDTLNLKNCMLLTDISPLHTIRKLVLSYTNIKNFGSLNNIHTILLERCKELKDMSPFKRVHTLDLSYCHNIKDVSPLKNVHTLKLSYCWGITDVSELGKGTIHTLSLRGCNHVEDVSCLGNSSIHSLDLFHLNIITDVGTLGSVYRLCLSECYNISDVSRLGTVHTLDISKCPLITDTSALSTVHTLTTTGCQCNFIPSLSTKWVPYTPPPEI